MYGSCGRGALQMLKWANCQKRRQNTGNVMSLESIFILKGAKRRVSVINKGAGGNNRLFL